MKRTFIEINKWNAQKVIQTIESGRFNPEYIERPIDWFRLSKYGRIPEYIISNYAKHWDWAAICKHQTLSEEFIRNHMEYIRPHMASLCVAQNLSIDFVRDYSDEIHWRSLALNPNLTNDIKMEFQDKLSVYLETIKNRGVES